VSVTFGTWTKPPSITSSSGKLGVEEDIPCLELSSIVSF
jgi:hypothetical protein